MLKFRPIAHLMFIAIFAASSAIASESCPLRGKKGTQIGVGKTRNIAAEDAKNKLDSKWTCGSLKPCGNYVTSSSKKSYGWRVEIAYDCGNVSRRATYYDSGR